MSENKNKNLLNNKIKCCLSSKISQSVLFNQHSISQIFHFKLFCLYRHTRLLKCRDILNIRNSNISVANENTELKTGLIRFI